MRTEDTGHEFVLSVVVPTRNRAEYAAGTIRQILSVKDPDLQLVVVDNSDDDSLSCICAMYAEDSRLRYSHSSATLSFVANFSAGVAMADGEYICIIGDDDGINPDILEVARWAHRAGVRAVTPGLPAGYYWPRTGIPRVDESGQLTVNKVDQYVRVAKTGPELAKLLRNGCQGYLSLDLVKLYHGLVRRDALEQVRDTTGRYFGGLSPDIYAAVALSTVIDEVVCVGYPLTLPGICAISGSADYSTGRHTGELTDAPHFRGQADYRWADEVPRFYSVETIWADSCLAAIRDMHRDDLLVQYWPESLAVYCSHRHPEFRRLVWQHYRDVSGRRNVSSAATLTKTVQACVRGPLRDLAIRVLRRLTRGRGDVRRFSGTRDIAAAVGMLENCLREDGIDVRRFVATLDQDVRVGRDRP